VDLEYVVILTLWTPRGIRPKSYLPVSEGLVWQHIEHPFTGDGMEYKVAAVLNQQQMDDVAWQTWMNIDDRESGGIYKPTAFPNSLVPASVWFGEAYWDTTAYRYYICPFPAGLKNPNAYRFGKYGRHVSWMVARYTYEWNKARNDEAFAREHPTWVAA
jgi:hypothetical protein